MDPAGSLVTDLLGKNQLKRRASAETTIAATRNSAAGAGLDNHTGEFALYLFLFFGGQILDRLTVELQLANLNGSLLRARLLRFGDHHSAPYAISGECITHTLRLSQRFRMSRSAGQAFHAQMAECALSQ